MLQIVDNGELSFRSCRPVRQYASHTWRGRDNVKLAVTLGADAWLARHSVLVAWRPVKFDQIDQQ